ncbi:hypothetical protein ACKLTP_19515 (plasmid) [Paenarthrobacter ureafaciens]|uniref:hypothetical protein n=1 Tax=Micrococcaceae TaxID=1268 RepID=UPI00222E6B72|nr:MULTISPECIES: hypothetical protein [Micrococcaceae]MCW3768326.1 hypothetical protein [Paenarthrobacter sp. PAE-2]WJH26784.1 hypothetical protein JCQ34_20755 [Pseudarthrobacter defluvii]HJV99257.1 hypothetical protein [Arthrobacter sp.]
MKRALTALAALLVCTACAPVSTSTPAEPSPSASAATSATLSAGGKPQAPGGTAPATLGIAWDEASKTAALDTATKAMTLYARPAVTDKVWIQELGQLLTPQATADYQYVDPANIPVTRITGAGQLRIEESNGFGCHVVFPTDAGDYDVQLLRSAADKPWQVNRFTPPNGTK